MVYVVVSLLLKRNIGILFGVLRGPRSDAPFFFFIFLVLYRCDEFSLWKFSIYIS
jgi:hypothetical protein